MVRIPDIWRSLLLGLIASTFTISFIIACTITITIIILGNAILGYIVGSVVACLILLLLMQILILRFMMLKKHNAVYTYTISYIWFFTLIWVFSFLLQYPKIFLHYYSLSGLISSLEHLPVHLLIFLSQITLLLYPLLLAHLPTFPLTLFMYRRPNILKEKVQPNLNSLIQVLKKTFSLSFLAQALKKSRGIKHYAYVLLILIPFIITLFLEILLPLVTLMPEKDELDSFINNVQRQCGDDASCIVEEVTRYISFKVKSAWSKPESTLLVNRVLRGVGYWFSVDYWFLGKLGFSEAHVILWQGWGSCEEYAITTAYVLSRLGYSIRFARFTDIDHMWAEVYIGDTWYIVDPWHIGNYHEVKHLVPASKLASISKFSGDHKVLCTYPDNRGVEVDCSSEHGYRTNPD